MSPASYSRPEATARAVIYRFLSTAFLAPSPILVKDLREQVKGVDAATQILDRVGYAIFPLVKAVYDSMPRTDLEVLECRRAYASMFLSTAPPLIRESHFVRELDLECVESIYAELGLVYDVPGLEPDHLSVELDFMHRLALLEAVLWGTGNPLLAIRKEVGFLGRHLASWGPKLAKVAVRKTRNPFYRALLTLLQHFVLKDHAVISAVSRTLARDRRA